MNTEGTINPVKGSSVKVFLINGVQLTGEITIVAENAFELTRESESQIVYKHAIATVMPADSMGNR